MRSQWLALTFLAATPVAGQVPPDVAAERLALTDWFATGHATPATILALSPLGNGQTLVIGPASSDLPIPGFDSTRVRFADGVVSLEVEGGKQTVPRGRQVAYGRFLVGQDGPANRRMVSVYGPDKRSIKPEWFPYNPAMIFTVALQKAANGESRNRLDFDGVETAAALAGSVSFTMAGVATALTVYRFGGPDDEEAGLEIYFQDGTNDAGTYPAGRFVGLRPLPDGRYQLDFNRARNPFCAYRTVYPCPIPWSGNLIKTSVMAGERYVHPAP
ncbi:MAG: DUF1684 domain-containing protein [Gemmatimonadota bacterium]